MLYRLHRLIGALALAPSDPNILYVATGEANNRQTTSYGDGLYKSTDAGKTFRKIAFDNVENGAVAEVKKLKGAA